MSKYRNTTKLAAALKALANPNRLRMYTRLVDCCAPGTRCCASEREMRACVGELSEDLGIAPSTASHHISQLSHAGLIHTVRRGQNVECWVVPETLRLLATFFGQLSSGGSGNHGTGRPKGGKI